MMTNFLATLLAALAFNEFIHIIFEIWGARQKVSWLRARLDEKPHGSWPIHIDSLTKVLVLHAALFIVITGLAFGVLLWLNLSLTTLLLVAASLLVITYSFTTFGMDAYHQDIGDLIKRYKQQ